jgi:leader peptidase (prepilin peptidase)/N-methyltransferase
MNISILFSPVIFLLGASVGSFINVYVLRTLAGEDYVRGRSRCDQCRRPLAWYEMVPLLSFVLLRGRCRTCHKEIDVMHPVVELLTGALFVWWWLIGAAFFQLTVRPLDVIQPVFWLSVGLLLLLITVIDLRAMIIPDWAVLALAGLALSYRMLLTALGIYRQADFAMALFGAQLVMGLFLVLWLATRKRGLGFGDVKLVFPLGLLVGWPKVLVSTFLAFILGAVIGVLLILNGRAKFGRPLPFGPFLVAGTILALLWGDSLLAWYLHLLAV